MLNYQNKKPLQLLCWLWPQLDQCCCSYEGVDFARGESDVELEIERAARMAAILGYTLVRLGFRVSQLGALSATQCYKFLCLSTITAPNGRSNYSRVTYLVKDDCS